MGAADEAIQVCFEGAGGLVGAHGGEVGCGLAVEQAELAQVGGRECFQAGSFDLLDQGFEAAPAFFTQGDPVVGDHRELCTSLSISPRATPTSLTLKRPSRLTCDFRLPESAAVFLRF